MLSLLMLFACTEAPVDDGPLDLRVDLPELPTFGAQILGPEVEIAPYTEQQFCTFGTFDGEDLGIQVGTAYQDGSYGHHAVILLASPLVEDRPDGEAWDCNGADSMAQSLPLVVPTEPPRAGVAAMTLPAGLAVRIDAGTRYILQSHYLNTSDQALLVRDVMNLDGVPAAEVDTFASVFTHVALDIEVPPQGEQTLTASCEWEDEVEVLTVFGHMHEWGTAFSVDHVRDEEAERLYDVPAWDPAYRDAPPRETFARGELIVEAGDVFETTCSWANTTDETLRFPHEMCAFTGLVAPAEEPIVCVD